MNGSNGLDGTGCTVTATADGAEIRCGFDPPVTITNGRNGQNGQGITRNYAPPCSNPNGDRFVHCGNGTVTDTVTGLVWLRRIGCHIPGQGPGPIEALRATKDLLQNGLCGLSDNSSPGDWRLPTLHEIESVIRPFGCDNIAELGTANHFYDNDGVGCPDLTIIPSPWAFEVESLEYCYVPSSTIVPTHINTGTIKYIPIIFSFRTITVPIINTIIQIRIRIPVTTSKARIESPVKILTIGFLVIGLITFCPLNG